MDRRELASKIDHTLLRPEAGPEDIERLCAEALEHGFATVCVNPAWVARAAGLLVDGDSGVCSVVGFPLGATLCMAGETERAVADGADEIDMVIPVGHLRAGMLDHVSLTIGDVVDAAAGRPVKVIIETCLLAEDEKVTACRLALGAGASWVKTSTGYSSGGATAADVRLMREAVGGEIGVKASGGIRTLQDALAMLEAGAGRLGCSRSIGIVASLSG